MLHAERVVFRVRHRVFDARIPACQGDRPLDATVFGGQAQHRRLADIGAKAGEWLLRLFVRVEHVRFRGHEPSVFLFVVAQCVAHLTVSASRFPPVQQLFFQFLEVLGLTVFLTFFRIPAIFLKLMQRVSESHLVIERTAVDQPTVDVLLEQVTHFIVQR